MGICRCSFAATLLWTAYSALLPPGPLIVGYQNWEACNITQTLADADRGVNVVIWFAINLGSTSDGRPEVQKGPNSTCVADARAALRDRGKQVAHLISVGGWDAPHPNTSFSPKAWASAWHQWNEALPEPFDGLDWDLEGNDKASAPENTFTPDVMNLVLEMSILLKRLGYLLSLVPAQSYLDVTSSEFNLSLRNSYPDYHPEFHYHGMNCYAYFLAAAPADTFDIVTIQLYETWSRASQALHSGVDPSAYLQTWWAAVSSGWTVDFGNNPDLRIRGKYTVRVDSSQLVAGLSFGNEVGSSVVFLPDVAGRAYLATPQHNRPRGFGFWNIAEDYGYGPIWLNGTQRNISLSEGLNKYLHVGVWEDIV
eukprot:TRINITY_DN20402_c0_g1_i1.p1 TRINITY_DN20402_c0_g1~~TRINITY_DN20402_c0_g1_i1.p1  ORF type:complete len:367 (+),score=8.59 TRINITY_DN20402_c0_g1_i1:66-1166(+)